MSSEQKNLLDPAATTDLALRGRLCLFALQNDYANAFHLGNLVRIAFLVTYLKDAGWVDAVPEALTQSECALADVTTRAMQTGRWSLSHPSDGALLESLLDAYEQGIESVSVDRLVEIHQRAEANFTAPSQQRRSIHALLSDACSSR